MLLDPISTLIMMGAGEKAILRSPLGTAKYDPNQTADYAPDDPREQRAVGVPETKIEDVVGAVGGFTMQCTKKPPGLKANASKLEWRDETWTVLRYRQRTWMGKVNGYTLYLAI